MFPFVIHFDTISNRTSVIITPRSDSTFGWRRALHVTNSLQNPYMGYGQSSSGWL